MDSDPIDDRPLTPGPAAQPAVRHPQALATGEQLPVHYAQCYGCGPAVPGGLHMTVTAGHLSVHARCEITTAHQGAPGLAHGGLIAAVFDEAMGALNWLLMTPAVTGRLQTDFLAPVPVGTVLHVDAALQGVEGRKVYTRAEARLGPDGPVCARAAGLFIQVPLEHFRQHGQVPADSSPVHDSSHVPGMEINP